MTRWKLHRIEAAIYLIAMFSLPFGLAWGMSIADERAGISVEVAE